MNFQGCMDRSHFLELIDRYFRSHPIVVLLGPRQVGKTTLARQYSKKFEDFPKSNYFDLENNLDVIRLENPMLSLSPLSGLIIIDEIQRLPDLFPTLRVLIDKEESKQKYLILGSASRELIRQTSESLAGRIAYIEITPFSYPETHDLIRLWVRGGFPRSYLADTEQDSFDWREFYIRSFLEQDIHNLGFEIAPETLRRFWTMLAHYHGNIFNASEFARSFGKSDVSIKRYLDLLTGTFMVRQLQPWHENIKKRQVKAYKTYIRDSGILHTLIGIHQFEDLLTYPKLGASWEGLALEEIIRFHRARNAECFFWSTYGGAEIDLLLFQNGKLTAFEFKYSDAPKLTKSIHIALNELPINHLFIIYPGEVNYELGEKISVKGLKNYLSASQS